MLEPGQLEKAFKKVEEENWMFRSFLKGEDSDHLDSRCTIFTGNCLSTWTAFPAPIAAKGLCQLLPGRILTG